MPSGDGIPAVLPGCKSAPGRLPLGAPVAVIDIGSNSVRLVAYEGLTRSPTQIFNEKASCGLGRSVASTGRLADEAIEKALAALRRFRALCDTMQVAELYVLATAAARDAANGPEFLAAAEQICRTEIELLSGKREARMSALGVVSGIHKPSGLVGDMGGGSLELIDVEGARLGSGVTLPLGGLMLQDAASNSLKKAEKLVRDAIDGVKGLKDMGGRSFYAVGGTWRALGRLHMQHRGYELHVMHNYTIPAKEALDFCDIVKRMSADQTQALSVISSDRRPLLPYGALVLEHIVRRTKPKEVVLSASGVREGLLYSLLEDKERALDPLVMAARELGYLRSRSPRHGEELIAWTDAAMAGLMPSESEDERRLRHAACHLADISWRAHPDYRGEQSLNIIANAGFIGIDHPGRAFLALSVYYRYEGLSVEASHKLVELAGPRLNELAKLLGGLMRVGYLVSAATEGVLPRTPLVVTDAAVRLRLPEDLAGLVADRLGTRMRQLGRLVGREPGIVTG